MHEPEHALEEVAHGGHGGHDSFDKRVAITMVVVAALLAGVKVLGHRAHNDTLRYQIEAGVFHTQESDQWAYFQSKKQRQYLFESEAAMLAVLAKDGANPQASSQSAALIANWKKKAERYESETKQIEAEAKKRHTQAEEALAKSGESHHRSDRFDLGELGVELALVLCSVAILTKRAGFWYGGIAIGLLGATVGISGLFVH